MSTAQDLNWLTTAFTERVPLVAHAAVVSSDGLPLACSSGLPADRVDQLAAMTSGLTSLVHGAARIFEGGPVTQTVTMMEQSMLILKLISDNSVLAILAGAECDLGLVTSEMVLLGEQVGGILTPEVRRLLSRRPPGLEEPGQ